jgi:hypothetical protein
MTCFDMDVAANGERDIPRDRLWSVEEVLTISASRSERCIHGVCSAAVRRVAGSAGSSAIGRRMSWRGLRAG